MNIDITTTATLRKELLENTLQSFAKYLFNDTDHEYRLIINIDCAGNSAQRPDNILEVARKYFNNITANIPDTPNFSKAFKWTWKQVTAPLVFHLEDDWELMRKIDLNSMIRLMSNDDKLAILRLSAFTASNTTMKNWNRFYPWNGVYYECPKELIGGLAFAGHPSLIKGDWVRFVVQHLNGISNPEKQIKGRDRNIGPYLQNFSYGVFSEQNVGPAIIDRGRPWMVQNNLVKEGSKAHFTKWVRV